MWNWLKRLRCGHGPLRYWFTYYGDQRMYLSDTQGPHLHRCPLCGHTLYLYEKLIPTDDWEKPANTTPLADIAKLATRKRAPTVTPYDPTGHN